MTAHTYDATLQTFDSTYGASFEETYSGVEETALFHFLTDSVGVDGEASSTGSFNLSLAVTAALAQQLQRAYEYEISQNTSFATALLNAGSFSNVIAATIGFEASLTLEEVLSLLSGFSISSEIPSIELTTALVDGLVVASETALSYIGNPSVSDSVQFQQAVSLTFIYLLQETAGFTTSISDFKEYLQELIEKVQLLCLPTSELSAQDAVASAMAFTTLALPAWQHNISENVEFADALADWVEFLSTLTDTVGINDALSPTFEIVALLDDTVSLSSESVSSAELFEALQESLSITVQLTLPSSDPDDPNAGSYAGWVMNTRNRAFSRYSNMPFNSFAVANGVLYGASTTGIYKLEGDDDDGVAIDAAIRTGFLELGSRMEKAVPLAYLGIKADGGMLLKVITETGGAKTAHTYELVIKDHTTYTQGRVEIGRGLRSRYWAFELQNEDGADFELDTIEVMPVVLSRRI